MHSARSANCSGACRSAASVLIVAACLIAGALLSGCATAPAEPKIVTQRVEVPVAVKCAADPGPDPAYVDTAEALKAAPDLFGRVKLLLAGRAQRDARLAELAAANAGCR